MDELHAEPLRVVLDTSVFTNPDVAREFGATPASAFLAFLDLARKTAPRMRFYMPPSIFAELRNFLGDVELPPDFDLIVALQPPDRHAVRVPGVLLYDMIEDLRRRIDRGLRLAESAVREGAEAEPERAIARLRDRYRQALRAGFLDSREDVDLVLLARQLGAALASADRGVIEWADRLGVRVLQPTRLRPALEAVAARRVARSAGSSDQSTT